MPNGKIKTEMTIESKRKLTAARVGLPANWVLSLDSSSLKEFDVIVALPDQDQKQAFFEWRSRLESGKATVGDDVEVTVEMEGVEDTELDE